MLTINLTDLERSDIEYKISKFPDGQQNITIIGIPVVLGGGLEKGYKLDFKEIKIASRLNNWLDLELIVATTASLRELGVKEIHLYVPYFLGARSDRKFEEGNNWYLKQVLCPIINSLNFETVTVLDAHSFVLGNLLNNYKAIDNKQLVGFAINQIYTSPHGALNHYDKFVIVSPDAGASHKIHKLSETINYKGDIVICSKERDTEGKLTKTIVPMSINYWNTKDKIIIDDICDGGRTFINIAKELKKQAYSESKRNPKIYLIVTHGIFSAGFDELSKYFDGIYCTNSYSDIGDKAMINGELQNTNVKQLKVI